MAAWISLFVGIGAIASVLTALIKRLSKQAPAEARPAVSIATCERQLNYYKSGHTVV